MKNYIKKPVKIQAVKWTGDNLKEISDFMNIDNLEISGNDLLAITINTLEGDHLASNGDYIIKGIKGEFYPCKPDIFEKTYYTEEEYAKLNIV